MPFKSDEVAAILDFIEQQRHIEMDCHAGWKNFAGNVHAHHTLVLDVKNVISLQAIVKKIDELNAAKLPNERITLRAAAGGRDVPYSQSFSFTKGAEADVIVRLVGEQFREINQTSQDNVMRVGASLQVGELEETLYNRHNLSVATTSLIRYVTVAGLSGNAGHGTGKDQPAFSGLIRAMTFCLPNGNIVRIDNTHKDFETIRAAHLGVFGILIDVEIECIPAKKLQCVMEVRSLPAFLDEVKQGLYFQDDYVSAMYVPTYHPNELTNRELKNVIIYRFRPVDKNTANTNCHPAWSHLGQEFEIKLDEGLHITDLLSRIPELIPDYMRYLVTRSAIGEKDKIAVGPWSMFHYQTAFPSRINDVDCLFPVSSDCHEIVAAFEQMAQQLQASASKGEYPVTYAAYARLFQGTNGGLSTSTHPEGKHVCAFDIVSSPDLPGFNHFRDEMMHFFLDTLQAKPHWGKYVPLNIDYEKMYGNHFNQFVTALQSWYQEYGMPLERGMLLNEFACSVLKLNDMVPVYHEQITKVASQCDSVNVPLLAKSLAMLISDKDPYAKSFRKHLERVAVQYSVSNHNLFQPGDRSKKNGAEDKVKAGCRKCTLV